MSIISTGPFTALTYGSCEVVVGIEPLVTASVGDVPDPECLVVRGGEEVLAPGVPGDACKDDISAYCACSVPNLTSDPVVVPHQGEQALAAADVPHPYALVPAPAGQEGTRVGATEMMDVNMTSA